MPLVEGQEINTFGELIDVLAETAIDLDDQLLEIDVTFPIKHELDYWRTSLGWRIRGF